MKLVQEITAISLGVENIPIGIMSADYPAWGWYVGAIDKVKWMLSGNNVPGRMEEDPVRYEIDHLLDELEDVEVLLVQGDWSLINDKLWNMKSIKTILKFESGNSSVKAGWTKRRRLVPDISSRWIIGRRKISHQANGKVTNERFKFEWAVR